MGPKENVFRSDVRILGVFCGLQFHVYAHLPYSTVCSVRMRNHMWQGSV